MLKRLRWRLSLTYVLATFLLMTLVGGGSYIILQRYLQSEIDLTLFHGMVSQFSLYEVPLPDFLVAKEQQWVESQLAYTTNQPITSIVPNLPSAFGLPETNEEHDHSEGSEVEYDELSEHAYESALVSVFVFPLDQNGNLLFNPNPYTPPTGPDILSFQSAKQNTYDIRTIRLPDGSRVRLLSTLTNDPGAPFVLQLGRSLTDLDRTLRELFLGILFVGALSMVVVGVGSWWLAGRSLGPAQRAWDLQQTFVSNASHELRTPLTLIRANAEFALRKLKDNPASENLQEVLSEIDYLTDMIQDLLLLSRLDAGHIELEKELIPVSDILDETAKQARLLGNEHDLHVQIEPQAGNVYGDPARIRQILLILLDNAIKYTKPGGAIYLRAHSLNGKAHITVEDTGRGIPREQLGRIFERFYQVPAEDAGKSRSNGLGLSIAKSLVEQHKGEIRAESELGKGTKMTIILPSSDKKA